MRRAGFTLVATLVTIALILFLGVYLMYGGSTSGTSSRKDGHGTTYLGAARFKAHDTVCMEHLRNVRLALELQTNSNGDERPAGLDELKQPADYLHCPIAPKEPYVYDPSQPDTKDAIKCVHPGHEKY